MIFLGLWEIFLGLDVEEKGENKRRLERFSSLSWVFGVCVGFFLSFISQEYEGFICVVLSMCGSEARGVSCNCLLASMS